MTTYHHECSICHTPFEYGDIKIFRGDDESRFCYYCAAKAAAMFETTSALIGKVTEVENGWEVAFAPDCTTWITVRRDEHDEPKVGDFITVTVPKAVAIHSQPNATGERLVSHPLDPIVGLIDCPQCGKQFDQTVCSCGYEHSCGGPSEACCIPGCSECGTKPNPCVLPPAAPAGREQRVVQIQNQEKTNEL